MGFPIPNIREMFLRLGSKRVRFMAACDLTSGYFQCPIDESIKHYFAFITSIGLFEWNRLPMGPKAAGSYFQGVLATVVLAGLIYVICELYIDDIIIHGATFQEFLSNFETVLKRFKKYNITLNPKKCKLGYTSLEYVGHVINEHGLSMSKQKRNVVKQWHKPVTMHDLRSFLGLANYFRDHIRNHSMIVRPLQDMIVSYDKNKRLIWSTEGEQAFELIKERIDECPSLFFMNNDYPVFLHTDASKYGIGAYLFQVSPDNVELPIVFISKSLSTAQSKWSVSDREAYAIFYAFQQLDYLISDRTFTLRTDHQNLVRINAASSDKLARWKIAIQNYDFFVEHISGKDNHIADCFSRLCDDLTSQPETTANLNAIGGNVKQYFSIPSEHYKTISKFHNSIAGHHGVDYTIDKLKELNHSWP